LNFSKKITALIFITFVLLNMSNAVKAETGVSQIISRTNAYAIAIEGEYTYLVGEAINFTDILPAESLDLRGGMKDIWLIKLQNDGTPTYTALIGGSDDDVAYGITVKQGVIYVLGETWSNDFPGAPGNNGESDSILFALSADGSRILWARRIGGIDQDAGRALSLFDEKLFLTGITWSQDLVPGSAKGDADGFVAQVDLEGGLEWLKIFGGRNLDAPFDIMVNDKKLWVSGQSFSSDFGNNSQGGGDAFAIQFNLEGEQEFIGLYGGRQEDIAYGIAPSSEGGFYLIGGTQSGFLYEAKGTYAGNFDGYLMNIGIDGNLRSVNYLGGSANDYAHDLIELPNGDTLIVGVTYSPIFPLGYPEEISTIGAGDAFIVRVNQAGEVTYTEVHGSNLEDYALAMAISTDRIWLAGKFTVEDTDYALWIPKSDLDGIQFPSPQPTLPTATIAPTATIIPTISSEDLSRTVTALSFPTVTITPELNKNTLTNTTSPNSNLSTTASDDSFTESIEGTPENKTAIIENLEKSSTQLASASEINDEINTTNNGLSPFIFIVVGIFLILITGFLIIKFRKTR
jgi:hypothetical protein